ncbi:hypothetical protein [Nocardioides sp. MH1]|uniref:hypothetical protein n=1 Tax=Nocardioides sp. MH1 TaxID=3242490 RepID=UPI00351FECF6
MSDHRLRDLLEDRVAEIATADLVDGAWERAHAVRRRRAAVTASVVVAAVVGTTGVVVGTNGGHDPAPPAGSPTSTSTSPSPEVHSGPKAHRAGSYGGADVWWAPAPAQEWELPPLTGTPLPPVVDLSPGRPAWPGGMAAVGIVQLWGDDPGRVVVIGSDGASYTLDTSRLDPVADGGGNQRPPVTQASLAPDGLHAFFVQERSLEVYDVVAGSWASIPTARWAAEGASWDSDGLIEVPVLTSDAGRKRLFSASGEDRGTTLDPTRTIVLADGDDPYGRASWGSGGWWAGSLYLAGPLETDDGTYRSIDAVAVVDGTLSGRPFAADMVLAMRPWSGDDARWKQCCPVLGWADNRTVLFESRWAGAAILAWRIGTPYVYRVSDIGGWTPGEESFVASFAVAGR